MTFTRALSTNNYGPSKFIVDGTTVANGTHSTIASALTSATSGDTIFIRPGTYTENITLKAGVNLCSYSCEAKELASIHVTILGKVTHSALGNVSISGIAFQTNGDFCIEITGGGRLDLSNCSIYAQNATGISSLSGVLKLYNCEGVTGAVNILFNYSTGGQLWIFGGYYAGSGISLFGNGSTVLLYSTAYYEQISITGATSSFEAHNSDFEVGGAGLNLTINCSLTTNVINNCRIQSATGSCISVGSNLTLTNSTISTANANAITGAGTLNYGGVIFENSSTINTTTKVPLPLTTFQGGTGLSSYATGDLIYASATNVLSKRTIGSTSQVLTITAGIPAWTTATFPSTATSTGTILRADGTNWVATTSTYPNTNAVSTLLYASASNVMSALATANNGTLVTSNTGVPSILAGPGTTGNLLQSNAAAAPSFSTTTYPSTNAINTLLYASAVNVMGALATANKGVLVTSATGVPSILTTGGTAGQVLQSTAAAAPAFSTATYPLTTTSQQILYSSAANVVGQLTTANSALAATNSSGTLAMRLFSTVIQTFTGAGTYTPTSGMLYAIIEVVGNGGGGGGSASTTAAQLAYAGGGGGGEYAKGVFSAATIGASQSVTFGATGTGGTAGANNGTAGGTVAVGLVISAAGGSAGSGSAASATTGGNAGGAGGSGGSGGSFRTKGFFGKNSAWSFGVVTITGDGSGSFFSGGVPTASATAVGPAGTGYGGGGGGASSFVSAAAQAGGTGSTGIVVVTEYVIA